MTVSSDPDAVTGDGFDESLIADINVTPLVDVMLVLLVVFMIAAPLMTHGVAIDLPKKGGGALGQPAKPLFVSLTHDGSVFLRNQRIAEGALVSRLRDIRAAEGDIPAYVRADRGIPYGMVMDVVSRVGEGGFSHISLLTQPSRPQNL